jgi:hypothetical protein
MFNYKQQQLRMLIKRQQQQDEDVNPTANLTA